MSSFVCYITYMTNETFNTWANIFNNLIGQLPWVAIAIGAVAVVGILAVRASNKKARRTSMQNRLVRGGLPPLSKGARQQMEREGIPVKIGRHGTTSLSTSYRRHDYR